MIRVATSGQVVVVGGGTAGTVAAVAAGRLGTRTILVESAGCLGGTSTSGLMNSYVTFHDSKERQAVRGIAQEIVDRLSGMGYCIGHIPDRIGECYTKTLFDSEALKYILMQMVLDAGVEILLHTYFVDAAVTEDGRVKGIIVENKSGRQLIIGDTFVDATGDGDVAVAAGALYEKESREELQPITLMFRIGNVDMSEFLNYVREHPAEFGVARGLEDMEREEIGTLDLRHFLPFTSSIDPNGPLVGVSPEQTWFVISKRDMERGCVSVNSTRVDNADGTDAKDLTRAEIIARRQAVGLVDLFRRTLPGFERSYLLETASQIGVRETRRIVGDYIITREDILQARVFEDRIAKGCTPIDLHGGAKSGGKNFWVKTEETGIEWYDIPYRCLLPRGIENLLVAGRCISSTHEAQAAVRMMPVCMATGQAAGTAAALSVQRGVEPRKLDIHLLQDKLAKAGQII